MLHRFRSSFASTVPKLCQNPFRFDPLCQNPSRPRSPAGSVWPMPLEFRHELLKKRQEPMEHRCQPPDGIGTIRRARIDYNHAGGAVALSAKLTSNPHTLCGQFRHAALHCLWARAYCWTINRPRRINPAPTRSKSENSSIETIWSNDSSWFLP